MSLKNSIKAADVADLIGSDALILDGRKIDGRTLIAKAWRATVGELAAQRGGTPSASEAILLKRAATLALLSERFEARLIAGENVSATDEESYRRSVATLGAVLIKLGMAKKSRDITARDGQALDSHAAAVLDAE